MNSWIRRTLIAVAGLATFAAAGLATGAYLGDRKRQRHIDVDVAPVTVPTDAASLARGGYLYASRGCAECHGADGAGHVVVDDGKGFLVKSPDITPGSGGPAAGYRDVDWVRAVRHGVKPDGRPLMVMPSEDFARMSDDDLGSLVAYVRTLPPMRGAAAEFHLPPLVRTLYAAGMIRDAAEKIDHSQQPSRTAAHDGSLAQGAYVAQMCQGCHGPHFSGGRIPGAPPAWPPAANLTPGPESALARYGDEHQFMAMLRTGRRPDGSAVSTVMPFATLRVMDDQDVAALYRYLRSLPAYPSGQR